MVTTPALFEGCARVLEDEESARAARFHFERDRRQFLVAHALLRAALSCFRAVAPSAWRFALGPHGRPYVASPDLEPALHFSLSHAHALVGVAISLGEGVGFDLEHRRRRRVSEELVAACLAPAEHAALATLGPGARERRFFQLWTLKEAYVKARGLGLSLPLEQFAFSVEPEQPVRVSFQPALGDDPARWEFLSLSPTVEHAGAVALRVEPGERLSVRTCFMSPPALLEVVAQR